MFDGKGEEPNSLQELQHLCPLKRTREGGTGQHNIMKKKFQGELSIMFNAVERPSKMRTKKGPLGMEVIINFKEMSSATAQL